MGAFIDELIKLAATKENCISQILHKTVDQRFALSEDQIDKLIEITDEKQILIDHYKSIQEKYELYYQAFKKCEDYHESAGLLSESNANIHHALEKINEIEQENEAVLAHKMEVIKCYVEQINQDKKGYSAYYQTGISVSEFIDQRN